LNERRVKSVGRPQYSRPAAHTSRRRSSGPSLPQIPARYILFVIGVVLILFGFYRMFLITKIVVTAPSRGELIQQEAKAIQQGSMQQGNLVTLSAGKFSDSLKKVDPLILSVELKRKWFHTLVIIVNLKQPGIGWTTGNQSYLVDRDGTIIDVFPQGSTLPAVIDDSNLPVKIGQRIVSTKFVSFVTELTPALLASGIKPTKIEVKDTTVDLYVTTDKNYQLIFDTSRAAPDEIVDLKGVLATLAAQKRVPTAYIDLRIPSKAYYK
jgi:cell division septal protein FtsQ